MFHKLHRQMTLFCTAVTGTILILLTVVCLIVAENGLKKNSYTSFLKESSSVLSHFQEQDTVSLQYLNGLREKNGFEFVLYDNGTPLFSQQLTAPTEQLGEELIRLAAETAEEEHQLSLLSNERNQLSSHAEFSLSPGGTETYYVCAGKISKDNGLLSFLIFYSLKQQQRQIFMQRLLFALADVLGLLLLALFSWFFTRRMLLPLEENHRKQNQFVASASHELRTPLAVILSGLEALEKSKDKEEQRHFADIMRREGKRMQRLISDMLLLANSDANSLHIQTVPCQPDELLLAAYEKYELLAKEKQIALTLTLPEAPLPDICCDGERILQVLSILLDNALSYTPAGGTVTLSATPLSGAGADAGGKPPSDPSSIPGRKFKPSSRRQERLLFSVSDTGCGVADADKKQIFERFYRVESSHTDKEHFGLGLCIAREIVDAHHGKLFVTDAPGGGACFCMIL